MGTRSGILAALAAFLTPDASGNIVHSNPPAQFDNTSKLATTGFVQRALGNFQSEVEYTAPTALTAAQAGMVHTATPGCTGFTLPSLSTVPAGTVFRFQNFTTGTITISAAAGNTINNSGSASSFPVESNGTLELVAQASATPTIWRTCGGSSIIPYSALFGASLSSAGYQKLPSGLIYQWGNVNVTTANTNTTFTLPIAFPNSAVGASVLVNNIGGIGSSVSLQDSWPKGNASSIVIRSGQTGNHVVIAIGY